MESDVENKKHTTVLNEIADTNGKGTIRRSFIRKNTVSRITVRKDKIVGYCRYPLHRGWLLRVIAEEHQCYSKKCPFLERVEDNPYWKECASITAKKKKRKREIKKKQEARTLKAAQAEIVLENIKNRATNLARNNGYEIIITRAGLVPNKGKLHVINYVSDKTENDYAEYMSICDQLRAEFHCPFILLKVKKPNGDYCTIDEWLERNPESKENIGIIPSNGEFIDIEKWLRAEENEEAKGESEMLHEVESDEKWFSEHDAYGIKELTKHLEANSVTFTEEHIEELVKDFYVVPKGIKLVICKPVLYGEWEEFIDNDQKTYRCSRCSSSEANPSIATYCYNCGAVMKELETKYFSIDSRISEATLSTWYQVSIDGSVPPVWTDKHIEALMQGYYLIPKNTKPEDRVPLQYADWLLYEGDGKKQYMCSNCSVKETKPSVAQFCYHCGAYMSVVSRLQSEGNVSPVLQEVINMKEE